MLYYVAKRFVLVISISTTVAPVAHLAADESEPPKSVRQIIESYVSDFRSDRFAAEPMLFGIKVPGEGEWHVQLTGKRQDDKWKVNLEEGPAPTPTFVFRVEAETLRAIDRGELNALFPTIPRDIMVPVCQDLGYGSSPLNQ